MALTVRRVDGAKIRTLTDKEIAKIQRREKRDEPHTHLVVLPTIRRPYVPSSLMEWTFPSSAMATSRSEPIRLPVPVEVGRSYWLVGDEVFWVGDLDITPADVLALLAVQAQRRDATLRHARAATPEPHVTGTHELPPAFSAGSEPRD